MKIYKLIIDDYSTTSDMINNAVLIADNVNSDDVLNVITQSVLTLDPTFIVDRDINLIALTDVENDAAITQLYDIVCMNRNNEIEFCEIQYLVTE